MLRHASSCFVMLRHASSLKAGEEGLKGFVMSFGPVTWKTCQLSWFGPLIVREPRQENEFRHVSAQVLKQSKTRRCPRQLLLRQRRHPCGEELRQGRGWWCQRLYDAKLREETQIPMISNDSTIFQDVLLWSAASAWQGEQSTILAAMMSSPSIAERTILSWSPDAVHPRYPRNQSLLLMVKQVPAAPSSGSCCMLLPAYCMFLEREFFTDCMRWGELRQTHESHVGSRATTTDKMLLSSKLQTKQNQLRTSLQ